MGRAIHGSVYQLRSPFFREILAPFSYELAVAARAWYGGFAVDRIGPNTVPLLQQGRWLWMCFDHTEQHQVLNGHLRLQ
ncbi:hypothetical protein [Lysobacter gummosus]|uniref:hypothetical protein n=1 Tax=Lysobacter gummosus TaxID=262324 RepID=UPI000716BE0D